MGGGTGKYHLHCAIHKACNFGTGIFLVCQKATFTEADRSMVAQHTLESMAAMVSNIHNTSGEHFDFLRKHDLPQLAV